MKIECPICRGCGYTCLDALNHSDFDECRTCHGKGEVEQEYVPKQKPIATGPGLIVSQTSSYILIELDPKLVRLLNRLI